MSASGGGGQEEMGGRMMPEKGTKKLGEKRLGGQDPESGQSLTVFTLASFSLEALLGILGQAKTFLGRRHLMF